MKFHSILSIAAVAAFGLVPLQAEDVSITKFNSSDVSAWSWENWSAPGSVSLDTSLDAGGGSPAGSLKLVNTFANKPGEYQQCVFTFALPAQVNALDTYTSLNFDVKVAPGSTPRANGDYGAIEAIVRNGSGWDWNSLAATPLQGTGWVHISVPIKAPADQVHHLTIKLGENALLGPITYNIDNISWTKKAAAGAKVSITKFDSTNVSAWYWENWSAPGTLNHDPSLDAGGGSPAGSLRLVNNFANKPAEYQQCVFTYALPTEVDALATFKTIDLDVRVDPSSTQRAAGDYGSLEIIFRNGSDWTWNSLLATSLKGTNWIHISAVVKAPADKVHHLTIKLGENALLGPVKLNIDNLTWSKPPPADINIATFDTDTLTGWYWENWSVPGEYAQDPALDSKGSTTSGSIRFVNNFENKPTAYQQCVFTYTLPSEVNAESQYTTINLDVKVDASSTPRAAGDYGVLEIIFRNGSDWTWNNNQFTYRLTSKDWVHLSVPVKVPADKVHHLTIKLGENALLGPVTYNIDNITWTPTDTAPPPPSLSLARAASGLTLTAASVGQYDRQNIRTIDNAFSWVDFATPVSYSFKLASYPDGTLYGGFQAHMFLVPGSPGNESSPDWNQPSMLFLDLRAAADGKGTAVLRWKMDEANGNSQLYAAGKPSVTGASILGTWTVTFTSATDLTIKAPDGTSTAASLDPALSALFAGGLKMYLGIQPNQTANIGQSAIFSSARITSGNTVLLEDSFSDDALDATKWQVIATSAASVQPISSAGGLWINWTVPDSGFVLQSSPSLKPAAWADLMGTAMPVGSSGKRQLLRKADMPGNTGFFRMIKQ